jgi:hypothetical protein
MLIIEHYVHDLCIGCTLVGEKNKGLPNPPYHINLKYSSEIMEFRVPGSALSHRGLPLVKGNYPEDLNWGLKTM